MGRRQQSNEGWDSPSIHDGLGLFRGPRSNVSECPGRLKLNRVAIRSAQEGHELGNQTSSDYVVNWGLFFPGEQFPKKVQGKHKLKVLSLRINNFKFKKIFKRLNSRVKNIKARQSLLGEAPWNCYHEVHPPPQSPTRNHTTSFHKCLQSDRFCTIHMHSSNGHISCL